MYLKIFSFCVCIILSGCYQSIDISNIELATKQCASREAKLAKITITKIDVIYVTCNNSMKSFLLQ